MKTTKERIEEIISECISKANYDELEIQILKLELENLVAQAQLEELQRK